MCAQRTRVTGRKGATRRELWRFSVSPRCFQNSFWVWVGCNGWRQTVERTRKTTESRPWWRTPTKEKKLDPNQPGDDDKWANLKTKRLVYGSQTWPRVGGVEGPWTCCRCVDVGVEVEVGPAWGRTIRQPQEHAAGEKPIKRRMDLEKVTDPHVRPCG